MTDEGAASDVAGLLARMQCLASMTRRVEDDQYIRAHMLQLSRELTATLQQPDEVVSLVSFSVRRNVFGQMQDFQLKNPGERQYVCKSSRRHEAV